MSVAGEVKSPKPLYREYLAFFKEPLCLDYSLEVLSRISVVEPGPGAASWTGVWLGMEPPVSRVMVFALAFRAHPEGRHGGLGPVVRYVEYDRVPRPAVGAVDERIVKTPVRRVEQLTEAVVAYSHVRGYEDELPVNGPALAYGEGAVAAALLDLLYCDGLYPRKRRRRSPQLVYERIDRVALDLYYDPF